MSAQDKSGETTEPGTRKRRGSVGLKGDGSIGLCPHQECGFRCCDFQQGNYIVLYPGELKTASQRGESLGHLSLVEPYHGGHKAVCTAADTASCDQGYKPLDCRSYPFFPSVDLCNNEILVALKGRKCPLTVDLIPFHRVWVEETWRCLSHLNPQVLDWLRAVRLVGYEFITEASEADAAEGDDTMLTLEEISVSQGQNADQLFDQIIESYLRPRPRVAARDEIDQIHREMLIAHPACRNSMYRRLLEGRMTPEQYQVFFSEYNQSSVKYFYVSVLGEALKTHREPVWVEYIHHIIEEESSPQPHWVIFEDFMKSCATFMAPPYEPAVNYSHNLLAGYTADLPFAAGYALGVEVEAGYQVAVLSKGLTHHYQEQLAQTDWFDVHIGGGQEEEHSRASVNLAEAVAKDDSDVARIRAGFLQFCDDVHRFMEEVNALVEQARPVQHLKMTA